VSYPVHEASPKAKAMIAEGTAPKGDMFVNTHHRSKYKFEQIEVGYCFTCPLTESETSLRNLAGRYGKKLGRKFAVLKHNDFGVFEVARIG
jgi:hypothetical protein